MPYIAPEVVEKAKRVDLLTYLQTYEPNNLVRLGSNNWSTKEHDSLKISNGKWFWWSRNIGGKSAVDYLMRVKGYSFTAAIEAIAGSDARPVSHDENHFPKKENDAPSDEFLLPPKAPTNETAIKYLLRRGIDKDLINMCVDKGLIYESKPYGNAVFVGKDETGRPRYASYRATIDRRIMGECKGSSKKYSFRINTRDIPGGLNLHTGEADKVEAVHVFESAIDLLSYVTVQKKYAHRHTDEPMLSLAGVSGRSGKSYIPVALNAYIERHPRTEYIYLHLDDDEAGRAATGGIANAVSEKFGDAIRVIDEPPRMGKDMNDELRLAWGGTNKSADFRVAVNDYER